MMWELRESFPLHFTVFKQTACHLSHEANVEQVFSRAGLLADPNLLPAHLSTLVTVVAVYACHNGAEKASAWWVIATYAVITVGELCLSPMGLSMVSKMAPARLAGLMMGGWQLATSLGNKLSGVLATMWDKYEDKSNFFWVNFVLLAVSATVLYLMLPWLKRVFRDSGVH